MFHTDRQIAAIYPDRETAEAARQTLVEGRLVPDERCRLLPPNEAAKLPPLGRESRRTRRALIVWHLILGAVGLVAGLAVGGILAWWQPQLLNIGVVLYFAVFCVFGLVFGLLAGGAVSFRPDEGLVFSAVRDELSEGNWALVTRVTSRREYKAARRALGKNAEERFVSL